MKDRKIIKDSMTIGLALFAMFFGAGSLIFPPYLGLESGTSWFLGFLCFIIADIGLAFVTIVAMVHGDGSVSGITGVVGKIPAHIINTAAIVCIGPFLAIPRTAATTYEMTVVPLLPDAGILIVSIVFFGLTWLFTIRASKVIDILGNVLTPALFLCLVVLIGAGIIWPVGEIDAPAVENVVKEGVLNGYQAMDVLAALGFAIMIIQVTKQKGYTEPKAATKVITLSCLLSGIVLFLVYCGLTYLGATVSSVYELAQVNQASLIVEITEDILGFKGVVILGIVVGLACLTTAIGLTSASAQYFNGLTGGKWKYESVVTIIILFSLIVSNLGLSAIIRIATPVLSVVYPTVVTLICLSFFKKKIRNVNLYKGAAAVSFAISFLTVLSTYGIAVPVINELPFAEYGFNWLIPTVLGGCIGNCIKSRKQMS